MNITPFQFNASGHAYSQTKFTPKGVNWIAGRRAQHCLQEAA